MSTGSGRSDDRSAEDLAAGLGAAKEAEPLLREMVRRMDAASPADRVTLTSALLAHFDAVRRSGPPETLGNLIQRLRSGCLDGAAGAEFLDNAYKAFQRLLEEAYMRIIRTVTKSYRTDGTTAKCPKCGSTRVREGPGVYEMAEMTCDACDHHEYLDDTDLETWYPEPGAKEKGPDGDRGPR